MRISDWSSEVCSSDLARSRLRARAGAPPPPESVVDMLNLAEYRDRADRLADHLPWAALVAPGVVLNQDGSFQRTHRKGVVSGKSASGSLDHGGRRIIKKKERVHAVNNRNIRSN